MDGTEATLVATTSGEDALPVGHYSRRVIIGNITSVRGNLKFALEKLDYFVEHEEPSLIAKRKNQLSYVKRLQISLTPSTDSSTVADFAYAIMNSAMTKGDRKTLEAEINALVALATSRRLQTACPACGTNNTSDARFCRVCGIANTAGEPAELEVWRLTLNARAAHQTIVGGVIFILCWICFVLLLWLFSHQSATAAAMILGGGALFGSLWVFNGIFRLHRTLNLPDKAPETLAATVAGSFANGQTSSLPPLSARGSITEGTTELLKPLSKDEMAGSPRSQDTNEIY